MRLSLASSLASSLFAIVANSQADSAAASSIQLGRAVSAHDRHFPEPQPSGGRPQAFPRSKAIAVHAPSLEDRIGPQRGLGSLDDMKASPDRELEELTCPPDASGSPVDFVDCDNGIVKDSPTQQTCADACGGLCCIGGDACTSFTGRVCKDGISCRMLGACVKSSIGLVSRSCNGDYACEDNQPGPTVRYLNSCLQGGSCGILGTFGGIMGDIVNSCHGGHACLRVGLHPTGGVAGGIYDSCIGLRSCRSLATKGKVSEVRNSCRKDDACDGMAAGEENPKGLITNGVHNSCNGIEACRNLGSRGTISTIFGSCNINNACSSTALNRHYTINNGIHTCCNNQSQECQDLTNDAVLPAECPAPPPTKSPTFGPTSSPTPSNIWTLDLQDTSATLANDAEDDIAFSYLIAAGRDYEISLREKGCAEDDEVDGALYTVTKSTTFFNNTHQWLNVSYSLVKEALASSRIWNNDTSTIELCQVTGLTTQSGDPTVGNLTVAQSITELELFVNSVANFTIVTNLTGAVIFNETEEVDAAAAVRAFKCDKNFEPNNDKLSPNAELFTCVGSKDDAFTVDTVDTMTITQSGKNPMKVIDGGNIQIPSITSTEPLAEGIIVRSRIPINLFDFEEGKILTIEGAVTMKLADGSSRRLNVERSVRNLQDELNEASYTVDVALEAAEESAVDLSNSAAGIAAVGLKGFAIAAFFLLL